MKYLLLLLVILFPIKVFSYNDTLNPLCTLKEKARLRNDVLNFNYELEKYKEKEQIYYKITIHNMNQDVIVEYDKNIYTVTNNIIYKILPGTILKLDVYATPSGICDGFDVSIKTLSVPYFNIYKDDELCVGNEEYFLCKENVNTSITREEFEKKIKEYEKSKEIIEKDEESVKKSEKKEGNIITFILDYYVYIIFVVIVIGVVTIIILLENRKKRIL